MLTTVDPAPRPASRLTGIILGRKARGFSPGLPHPFCRRAEPGAHSGRFWPSMYCLMIDSGPPLQETAKFDGDQGCPRMRAQTSTPVYSRRTA
jgi:hypothetical protein